MRWTHQNDQYVDANEVGDLEVGIYLDIPALNLTTSLQVAGSSWFILFQGLLQDLFMITHDLLTRLFLPNHDPSPAFWESPNTN